MVLSDEQLKKFQSIYKSKFGKDISKEEAYEKGIKLFRLLDIIYKPMTQEDFNFYSDERTLDKVALQ
jgi:hypothetical protein